MKSTKFHPRTSTIWMRRGFSLASVKGSLPLLTEIKKMSIMLRMGTGSLLRSSRPSPLMEECSLPQQCSRALAEILNGVGSTLAVPGKANLRQQIHVLISAVFHTHQKG